MGAQVKYIGFAVYTLICAFHGVVLGAFGPVILYFSKVTNHDETYFSFIFFAKAIGFLIGGYVAKVLPNCMSYHKIFILSISLCGLALIASSLDFGFWNLTITMVIIGATCCVFQIFSTLCIFEIFFQDDEQYWYQLASIFFGFGGLAGPLITFYTEELSLRAIGIMIFICITPLFLLKSPQVKDRPQEEEQGQKLLDLPLALEILICLLVFINVGLIAAYPNWMPTYAVKTGVFNKKQANLLISIFWIVEILGKIMQLCMKGTIKQKCYFLMRCLLVCAFISVVLQLFQFYAICTYFSVATAGFFLAPMFALFYTIAQEHGYKLDVSAIANITIASILAEGVLIAPMGYIIGFFGFKSFIYLAFIITVLMYAIFSYTISYVERDSKEKKNFLSIQEQ